MNFASTIIGTAERVPLPMSSSAPRLTGCARALPHGSPPGTPKAMPGSPMRWRRAPMPNTPARPTPGTPRCRLRSSLMSSALPENTPHASTRNRPRHCKEAEEEALRQTVEHAELADGQSILELGCGWGSLSLFMARQFPHSLITAVSNSNAQREYIEGEAAQRGLTNLRVITQDMSVFTSDAQFDRVVSVEMFEQMMNWRELMTRVGALLKPDGRFFLHIFTHRSAHCSIAPMTRTRYATFLWRRRDAEPSSDPAICRSIRGRKGMALEQRALSAHRAGLAGQFR